MSILTAIVSSGVKAEMFRLLFGPDRAEWHLRELARRSGYSLGTVQQELRNLVTARLVLSRKDGNRVCFRANIENPVYPEIASLVLKTGGLTELLGQALDVPGVSVAFVFGSIARDKARPDSDVDLMVIGKVGMRALAARLAEVGRKVGRELNPHVIDPAEFANRQRTGNHFLNDVLGGPKLFVKGDPDELAAMGAERVASAGTISPDPGRASRKTAKSPAGRRIRS